MKSSKHYQPAASGAPKAYDRKNPRQSFSAAEGRCGQDQDDDHTATLIMPKTAADIEDIKEFTRE